MRKSPEAKYFSAVEGGAVAGGPDGRLDGHVHFIRTHAHLPPVAIVDRSPITPGTNSSSGSSRSSAQSPGPSSRSPDEKRSTRSGWSSPRAASTSSASAFMRGWSR
ncbi:carbon starvation A domain protein [Mycobacterium xenopi 3993]|nr:carbon starvation A domain protein [Mycobacterium xenopi 3993]